LEFLGPRRPSAPIRKPNFFGNVSRRPAVAIEVLRVIRHFPGAGMFFAKRRPPAAMPERPRRVKALRSAEQSHK
jgi:hypothetical protein